MATTSPHLSEQQAARPLRKLLPGLCMRPDGNAGDLALHILAANSVQVRQLMANAAGRL